MQYNDCATLGKVLLLISSESFTYPIANSPCIAEWPVNVIMIVLSMKASVEGFCKYLKVDEDEALALIGQSVAVATEARMQFTLENKVLVGVEMCFKCL